LNQLMMHLEAPSRHWQRVKKSDISCRLLADRHYSRQTVGDKQFCRPGRNIVMRTAMGDAVWVTWQGIRDDGYDAWECTIFRNESEYLSSDLIKEAVTMTIEVWGKLPMDGIITTVDSNKIKSKNPGYCFKKAGFKSIGKTKVNKLIILQYKPAT
jgi:hypothetical protein